MTVARYLLGPAAFAAIFLTSCAWVQGLREEVRDEGDAYAKEFDYAAPENRFVPPPPATVVDKRAASIAGTPVDLSGMRAKSGRVTKQDFLAEGVRNENSLWQEDGQRNYLFAQNNLKMPGDLVTVVIEDELRNDMVGEVKKLLPPEYREQDIRVPGLTKEKGEEQQRAPAATGVAAAAAEGTGALGERAKQEFASSDVLTAEVLERYPNGNLRLRGVKRVPFKRQVRNIEVTAIARGRDVSEDDVVRSSKFFEQHVELYK